MDNIKKKHAILQYPGKEPIELPIISGTDGTPVIDITHLKDFGIFTFDPGLLSTAICASKIALIKSEASMLLYRGYAIEDLINHSDYLEVCYLLLNDELPTNAQKNDFVNIIKEHALIHEQFSNFYEGFPRDAHPMAIMCALVGGLSAFYHHPHHMHDREEHAMAAFRIIAKLPTLAAMTYKYIKGQPFVYPNKNFNYAENFLHMMFCTPLDNNFRPDPILVKALDQILILHAEHEQNVSTSTVRLVGSSLANPFVCVAAGIAALWGPAHGGANEAALTMLEKISDEKNIDYYLSKASDTSNPFKLMGFGHRVYKSYDPRALVMKKICFTLLKHLKQEHDPLFKLALTLEERALQHKFFLERQLFPNIDFYSGIALKAIGIPKEMFTVIFALGRTIGWLAHWKEMLSSKDFKISRPRQLYIGPAIRKFIPIQKR